MHNAAEQSLRPLVSVDGAAAGEEMVEAGCMQTEAAQELPQELHVLDGDWLDMQCDEEDHYAKNDHHSAEPSHLQQDDETCPDHHKQVDLMLKTPEGEAHPIMHL